MHLGIPDVPPAEFFVAGTLAGPQAASVEVVRAAPVDLPGLLEERAVDVALVPTLTVLRDPGAYDVFPGVALSSWAYPYARLVLGEGLGEGVRRVAFDPRYVQEVLVARLVIREHYGFEPVFEPHPTPTPDELLNAGADAALLVGPDVPTFHTDRFALDIGQEWYEFANYPMVWGLFVAPRGAATKPQFETLLAMAADAEAHRAVWLRAHETNPALHAFYRDGLRIRFDDLAVASLTELRHHLYYHQALSDMPDILPVHFPDRDDADDEDLAL